MTTATNDRHRDLGTVLAEFAKHMADPPDAESVLERLATYCTELLPVYGVGVLIRRDDGGLEVGTASTELGWTVETLEAHLGEGPCTKSQATGEQVGVVDLMTALDEYPRFVPKALEAGARSVHALPLVARGEQFGAVDLIAREPLELSPSQLATGQMLADVAISYLVNARNFEQTSQLARQLQGALDSRIVIEQAKGRLAERHELSLADAFNRLRTHARSHNLKIREVATAVLRDELDV